jgi:KAP family P-loop domain
MPAGDAVEALDERITDGDSISRLVRRRFPPTRESVSDRAIQRWHEENIGVLEGLFADQKAPVRQGRAVYDHRGLLALLDSELRQLSAMRERIAVRAGIPARGIKRPASPAPASGSSASSTASSGAAGGGTAGGGTASSGAAGGGTAGGGTAGGGTAGGGTAGGGTAGGGTAGGGTAAGTADAGEPGRTPGSAADLFLSGPYEEPTAAAELRIQLSDPVREERTSSAGLVAGVQPGDEEEDGQEAGQRSSAAREPAQSGSGDPTAGQPRIAIAAAASVALPAYDADAASTRDFVGIDAVADAFSYLLASTTAQPPLAIGLFGEWGSGKSFLMQTIRRRVDEVTRAARQSELPQAQLGVYKRVVQIEFNAWHYVEGNLWASLVEHIFANLRVTPEDADTELRRRQQKISDAMVSITRQKGVLESRIEQLEKGRSQAFRDEAKLRADQQVQLRSLRHVQLRDVVAAVKLSEPEKDAVSSALKDVGLGEAEESAAAAVQALSQARTLVRRGGPILAPVRGKGLLWIFGIIVVIALAPAVAFALQRWNVSAVPKVLTSLAATAAGGLVIFRQGASWVSTALAHINVAEARVADRVEQAEQQQRAEMARLEGQIADAERQLAEARREDQAVREHIAALKREIVELTPGRILAEFLDQRAASLDYYRFLGLTALIRRDFEKLTELVQAAQSAAEADGATSPVADFSRVILFVDDLDRCPPGKVAEVLQAVHLLLSFPVFAVVVAVDPRWLARSLELNYPGLIEASNTEAAASTAQDYLEKIFQIPFRVAPLDEKSRGRFMSGLVSRLIGEPAMAPGPALPAGAADHIGAANGSLPVAVTAADPLAEADGAVPDDALPDDALPDDAVPHGAVPHGAVPDGAASDDGVPDDGVPDDGVPDDGVPDDDAREVDLNPASMQLDEAEAAFLGELLPILDSSPRGLKRYVNIYRLIKAVAIPSVSFGRGDAELRMFLLALLTSFAAGPELISQIIGPAQQTELTLGELITNRVAGDSAGPASPEEGALAEWLARHPAIAECRVQAALEDARHVRLYSFN